MIIKQFTNSHKIKDNETIKDTQFWIDYYNEKSDIENYIDLDNDIETDLDND